MQIVVLGMHRSGTSSVTNLLHAAGAYFGPDSIATGTNWENPKGFWERRDMRRACDHLLQASGFDWWKIAEFAPGMVPEKIRIEGEHRIAAVVSELDAHRPWVVKEPRLCLLQPFLKPYLTDPVAVVVIRHPWEVARSLKTRNNIPEDVGLALWARYTKEAIDHSADLPRILVDYNALVTDPDAVGRKMIDDLAAVTAGRLRLSVSDMAGIIEPRLRRQTNTGVPSAVEASVALRMHAELSARGLDAELSAIGGSDHAALRTFEAFGGLPALQRLTRTETNERKFAELTETIRNEAVGIRDHIDATASKAGDPTSEAVGVTDRSNGRYDAAKAERSGPASMPGEAASDAADGDRVIRPIAKTVRKRDKSRDRLDRSLASRIAWPFRAMKRAIKRQSEVRTPSARTKRTGNRGKISAPDGDASLVAKAGMSTCSLSAGWYFEFSNRSCAVVVPICGSADRVEDCLDALVSFTDTSVRIIVINDTVMPTLPNPIRDRYGQIARFEWHENAQRLGFSKTFGKGIALAGDRDVVSLSPDVTVCPGWLRRLQVAAYSDADIATASPLFDEHALIASAGQGKSRLSRKADDRARLPRALIQIAAGRFPEVASTSPVCRYIKRAALDASGSLGHEVRQERDGKDGDSSIHGTGAGWRHVIDDRTVVHFTPTVDPGATQATGSYSASKIDPQYYYGVGAFDADASTSAAITDASRRVDEAIVRTKTDTALRPRVLFALGDRSGDPPWADPKLVDSLRQDFELYMLQSDGKRLELSRCCDGGRTMLEIVSLADAIAPVRRSDAACDDVLFRMLVSYGFELVHVQQVVWYSADLGRIARALDISVIVSLQGFYAIFPELDPSEDGRLLRPDTVAGDNASRPDIWQVDFRTQGKNFWQSRWRRGGMNLLKDSDVLISPTHDIKKIACKRYPILSEKHFPIVPVVAGEELFEDLAASFDPAVEALRILIPGDIKERRDIEFLLELNVVLESRKIEFHVLGNVHSRLRNCSNVVEHGPCTLDGVVDAIHFVRPHLGCFLAPGLSASGPFLTELWTYGIPVIGFDTGVVGQRVRRSGGGWLLLDRQARTTAATIEAIIDEPGQIEARIEEIRAWRHGDGVRMSIAMIDRHMDLYQNVGTLLDGPGIARAGSVTSSANRRPVWTTGAAAGQVPNKAITILDMADLRGFQLSDPEGVAVIMPSIDVAKATETAEVLLDRAGMRAHVIIAEDTERQGFVATLNAVAERIDVRFVAYVAEDAFPGFRWLRLGVDRVEEANAGLLAFNCGKWQGRIAAFGLVRTAWVKGIYGGPIFYPGYDARKADNELTVLARLSEAFVYAPEATLVEVDPRKGRGREEDSPDRTLFRARFRNGFDGRFDPQEIMDRYAAEYGVEPDGAARSEG